MGGLDDSSGLRFGTGLIWLSGGLGGDGLTNNPGTTPSNAYVAEDGSTNYVAEDGTTFYVQES